MVTASRYRGYRRQPLYDAERVAFGSPQSPDGDLDGTVAAAQRFASQVSRTVPFAPLFVVAGNAQPRHSRTLWVDPGYRGLRWSHAGQTWNRVRGVWRPTLYIARPHLRHRWLILHEAAHWCESKPPWHGAEFACAYLALVRRHLGGDQADRLAGAFIRAGIDHHPTSDVMDQIING